MRWSPPSARPSNHEALSFSLLSLCINPALSGTNVSSSLFCNLLCVPNETFQIAGGTLCQTPLERLTIDEMLRSEWLKGTAVPLQTSCQDCLSSPTITTDPNQMPGVERVARIMLEKLGIDGTMLATHADKGSRSSVIGTYRIVVHRLTKPPQNQLQSDASNIPKTPQSSNTKKGLKSKMCSIL